MALCFEQGLLSLYRRHSKEIKLERKGKGSSEFCSFRLGTADDDSEDSAFLSASCLETS